MEAIEPVDLLAFGPHPDDVELWAGGWMTKLAAAGRRLVIVDLTRGEAGTRGTPASRAAERDAATARLALAGREDLGLPDTGLVVTPDQTEPLVAAIRRWRPRVVLGPGRRGPASRPRRRGGPRRACVLPRHHRACPGGRTSPPPSGCASLLPGAEGANALLRRGRVRRMGRARGAGEVLRLATRSRRERPADQSGARGSSVAWRSAPRTGERRSVPPTESHTAPTAFWPSTIPSTRFASEGDWCCEDRDRLLPDVRRLRRRRNRAGTWAGRPRPRGPPGLLRSPRALRGLRRANPPPRGGGLVLPALPVPTLRPGADLASCGGRGAGRAGPGARALRHPAHDRRPRREGRHRPAAVPRRHHAARHGHHHRGAGSLVSEDHALRHTQERRRHVRLGVSASRDGPRLQGRPAHRSDSELRRPRPVPAGRSSADPHVLLTPW